MVGLRTNSPRPGRAATGLAALRITTTDQDRRTVLDFHRCAMLPLSPGASPTDDGDDLGAIGADAPDGLAVLETLDLEALPDRPVPPATGTVIEVVGGDVVSGAPELARLTLNVAQVHHDERAAGGRRLVYGGHTIGIAAHGCGVIGGMTGGCPAHAVHVRWAADHHEVEVRETHGLRGGHRYQANVP